MLVLVGFMGAGKTTVGKALATRLGVEFVDADELIVDRERRPVRAIFDAEGEDYFRDLEHRTIAELVAGPERVVAVGGGAVTSEATRRALGSSDATVVYLRVELEHALGRVSHDPGRPMLHRPGLTELYTGRLAHYEEVATVVVDTDGRDPDAVVAAVLAHVSQA